MLAEICAFALAILIILGLLWALICGPLWVKAIAASIIISVLVVIYACLRAASRADDRWERRG